MLKKLGLAFAGLVAVSSIALAAGLWQGYPLVGDTAGTTCLSTGNGGVCNQFRPAGPAALTGNEQIPADTGASSGSQPATVLIPSTMFGSAVGNHTINTTTGTGQNPVVADGIQQYIYAGAGTATFATITLPPNPMRNQMFCIVNAGSGVLTLTAINAGVNSAGATPTFVGVTPTSIPVMTAVGTAGTVTLGRNCWTYSVANTAWYRIL